MRCRSCTCSVGINEIEQNNWGADTNSYIEFIDHDLKLT